MAGYRSNRDILTGGKKYAQKQAKKFGVDEVVFDKSSRQEYLTGFHKRKLQRQKKAQEYNKEQERLARIDERKKLRDERKKDMENQLEKFNETVKEITSYSKNLVESESEEEESDEWSGFQEFRSGDDEKKEEDSSDDENDKKARKLSSKEKKIKGILQHREVYKVDDSTGILPDSQAIIDDETTVTVESLENPIVSSIQQASLEAAAKANNVKLENSDKVLEDSIKRAKNYAVVCGVSKPSAKDKIKQKKKKFRYLTKAERRENTRKERSKSKPKSK